MKIMKLKKMILLIMLMMSLIVITKNSFADDNKNASSEYVSALMTTLTLASNESDKNRILNEIKSIRDNNPSNKDVLINYINALIDSRQYSNALLEINTIKDSDMDSTVYLFKCMLKDRLNQKSYECYNKLITIKEQKNEKDIDYIMALYFSGSDKYHIEKEIHMKNNDFINDFKFLDTKRSDVILEMFP